MKGKSLFDTLSYFLMQVRSTSRICEGRDIAVILSEKGGGGLFFSSKLILFEKKIRNTMIWVLPNKPSITKCCFLLQYTIKGDCDIFLN